MFFKNCKYDIFISHAVEDKGNVANELKLKLEQSGLKVWYSSERLDAARNLDHTIKKGIHKSRHGVAILTPTYFKKQWTIKELHALWGQNGLVFYVLHGITKEEVEEYCGRIVNDWALDTKKGLDFVANEITRVIKQDKTKRRRTNTLIALLMTILPIISFIFAMPEVPSESVIIEAIDSRIETYQKIITNDHIYEISEKNISKVTMDEIRQYFHEYDDIDAYYRNTYYFDNHYNRINSRKNVEFSLNLKMESFTPGNNYGFINPEIYLIKKQPKGRGMDLKCIFVNTERLMYEIKNENLEDDTNYFVTVTYKNNIRYMSVHLRCNDSSDWMKLRKTSFRGFLPQETYHFEKEGNEWVFVSLE